MAILDRINNAFKAITNSNISEGELLARDFRRNGNRRMVGDWSKVVITDQDMYTGYSFASINNRANGTAQLATNNLVTKATQDILDAAKEKEEPVLHPYVEIIDKSKTFSNYQFWYQISTYLDLEGVYYLMAVRNKAGNLTGSIQEFQLLSPFDVKRVVNQETREVGGYIESRDGMVRNIPTHMIIEIRRLNPFSKNDPYSIADAARDSQFTLKSSSDYTRHAITKNLNSPGIITIDDEELAVDPQKFANFKSRVLGHSKGEPIFGTGKGAITYDDMQTDLNKSALDKVNEVNLNSLIAVTGSSKTSFGIEQSGVTRDSSKVQMDLFIANHTIPQLQLIIDALNQDYKNFYESDYEKNKYTLAIESPLGIDRDSEIKGNQIRSEQLEIKESLIAKGYDPELSAKYAKGEIDITELGTPKEVKEPVVKEEEPDEEPEENMAIHNKINDQEQTVLTQGQATLENKVQNIERIVVANVLKKVTKNSYETEDDVITKTDKKAAEKELDTALQAFYLIVVPLFAARMMNRRAQEFGKLGVFETNTEVKKYIKKIANKTAASHIDTIVNDLHKAVQQAALKGATQQELINTITNKYADISKGRAKAIARTETNRAFTQSQYQADLQFLKNNDYTDQAYKKWITTSNNPCALCLEMASRPPVAFNQDFLEFGSELSVTYEENNKTKVLTQKIDYEPLEAGNLHVNCGCRYTLIIEGI